MQFLTIILVTIISGTEIHIFLPSFPEISRELSLTPFLIEFTLAINMIGYCCAALFIGVLGDKYGRKTIIITGLIIFLMGTILCLLTRGYQFLIIGRFLQGIGIAAPSILSYIVISDLYSVKRQQEMIGLVNGVYTTAMSLAPLIGSFITLYYSWKGNFVFLLFFGIIILILSCFFIPKGKSNKSIKISLREYKEIFRSEENFHFTSVISCLLIGYWVFVGMSPIIYMESLKVGVKEFGFYQGTVALTFAFISFISGFFIRKFGQRICFMISIIFLMIFIFLLILMLVLKIRDPLMLTLIMQVYALGITFPVNVLYPLALETIPNAKARISAVLLGSRLLFVAFIIQLLSYFYNESLNHLGYALLIILATAFFSIYKLVKNYKLMNLI